MKIQNKLFLFLFSFSLILVTVLVLLMQWSIDKGMVEYVATKEIETLKPVIAELSDEYQIDGNWRSMVGQHHKFRRLISLQLFNSDFEQNLRVPPPKRRRLSQSDHMPPPKKNGPPSRVNNLERRPPPPESEAHYALLDANEKLIVGNFLNTLEYTKTPIEIDNNVIGYFAISKRNQLTKGYEVDFVNQQQHYLWLIALLVMSFVVLVTLPLARHIVEPIKLIAQGMHKLTQGEYKQSITLTRQDELSELSRDYNQLALTLAENETARKRWLANISHELRTPVAILRGELEAMLDKVRPLSVENITSANDEVKHLQRLIDDLNLLTSADVGGMRYRKQDEVLQVLIASITEKYKSYLADASITLTIDCNVQALEIYADKNRFLQLFENIINNCIKYSSATVLNISVKIDELTQNPAEQCVTIRFEDNGVGVEEEHLPHLFEHLYRVEDSRNRKTGGSGLGLSICRHIVMAHQGEISAQKSPHDGLAIIIKLPVG